MFVENLDSWDHFKERIKTLDREWAAQNMDNTLHVSRPLFRGQANACWHLETTLEREVGEQFPICEYYKKIRNIRNKVSAFTQSEWVCPETHQEITTAINDFASGPDAAPPAVDYLAYLRHHGFPSPLLDWSTSPFVAAFFAFRHIHAACKSATPRVAVYQYIEYNGHGKGRNPLGPKIISIGPNIKTHPRHFLQQSQYTICIKKEPTDWLFWQHKDVLKENEPDQDVLRKLTIPTSERVTALTDLRKYNVTAHSLFASEDSLAEALKIEEFVVGSKP